MIEEFIKKQRLIEDQNKKQITPDKIQQIEAVYQEHEVVHYSQSWIEHLFLESPLHLCLLSRPDKYASHFYHCHGWLELVYVHRGTCYNHFLHTDETLVLKEKEALILHPKVPHCTCSMNDTDQIFSFIIRLDLIQTVLLSQSCDHTFFFSELYHFLFVNQGTPSYLHFQNHPKYRLEPLLELTVYEIERNLSALRSNIITDGTISQALVLLLLSHLSQRYETNCGIPKKLSDDGKMLHQMYDYIQNHLCCITLNRLAEQFGYTPTYVSHLFREKMGKSYSFIVQHLRMEQAKYLLKNQEISISEIASLIGMSYDAFHKSFKKIMGMTPTQFRHLFHIQKKLQ